VKTKVIRKWLSMMKGQEWKDIRSSVTPAFTTGKIKRVILNWEKNKNLRLNMFYFEIDVGVN
jgi:hypothetical protein